MVTERPRCSETFSSNHSSLAIGRVHRKRTSGKWLDEHSGLPYKEAPLSLNRLVTAEFKGESSRSGKNEDE